MESYTYNDELRSILEQHPTIKIFVDFLIETINRQSRIIEQQTQEIVELKAEIVRLKNRPNSQNSSLPPSQDITRKSKVNPNRKKSKKKSGGQSGHKGSFLKMSVHKDHEIRHEPEVCECCRASLAGVEGELVQIGQIRDIPEVKIEITEHTAWSKECPHCKHTNKGQLPGTLGYCNVQYGDNLRNLIVLMNTRNFVSLKRIQEMIRILYNEEVSEGFIASCIENKAGQMQHIYNQIIDQIKQSPVVGSDETGIKVKDKREWIWGWRSQTLVYFAHSAHRDYATIERIMGTEGLAFIQVSDRYGAQLKVPSRGKQVCLVHLLRDVRRIIEDYGSQWGRSFSTLLHDIIRYKKMSHIEKRWIKEIESRLDQLMSQALTKSQDGVRKFQQQIKKVRQYITTCLYHTDVPAHNNSLEQSIRNIKLKIKNCTNFRSQQGAQNYAVIRSVIDSAILQGIPVMDVMKNPDLILN